MEIAVVRHGETDWSAHQRHTGRTDVPLTEEGRREAERLGRLLRGRRFVLVLTSPLKRAAETCWLLGYGNEAQRCDDLVEWDYGDYEGRTTLDIRNSVPGWTIFTHGAPNGETPAQVGERADRVLTQARAAGGDVLLVGHGHMLRVLTARWLGLEPVGGRLFALGPATLSSIGYEHETEVIRMWNEPAARADA